MELGREAHLGFPVKTRDYSAYPARIRIVGRVVKEIMNFPSRIVTVRPDGSWSGRSLGCTPGAVRCAGIMTASVQVDLGRLQGDSHRKKDGTAKKRPT